MNLKRTLLAIVNTGYPENTKVDMLGLGIMFSDKWDVYQFALWWRDRYGYSQQGVMTAIGTLASHTDEHLEQLYARFAVEREES